MGLFARAGSIALEFAAPEPRRRNRCVAGEGASPN